MDVKGKVALITGSATGIGRATALELAKKGAGVVINYSKSLTEARSAVEEAKKLGADALLCQADVSRDSQVREMVKEVQDYFGRIDILVNNAGATDYVALNDLEGVKDEYWDRAFNTNVKSAFYTIRSCAEELKKNRGCIVNVTSIAGLTGQGSSIAYAASKAAAISLTKSMAVALAPEVRVNSVAPGIVLTRWVAGKDEHIQRLSAGTPLGRAAYPEDVAQAIVSLVTGGDFITGQTVVVDGGFINS
ncbi:MAG: SDR family NAD(P)-dependent oxidoreductase [Peptococcaceae bacterium]